MVCPLHRNSKLWISLFKMDGSFHCWKSSNGGKVTVQRRLHFFAIQVVPLVCLYISLPETMQQLLILCKQKGVMISHRNVISNVLQIAAYEKTHRDSVQQPGSKYGMTEVALCLLPQSHIYSLVVVCHATTYRGDQVINLPKFEMQQFLTSIQRFKINILFLVSHFTFYRTSHSLCKSRWCQEPPLLWKPNQAWLIHILTVGTANYYCHGKE